MSRVFDCCIFAGEWPLLELRFQTLKDVVDVFIVVEGDRTHSGKTRTTDPERIREMAPTGCSALALRVPLPAPVPDRWMPERTQRNGMLVGLVTARAEAEDHIVMSDVDELPDPAHIRHQGTHWQRQFLYYLNAAFDEARWPGSIGLPYTALQFHTPAGIRAQNGAFPRCEAGWHFSYMGGVDAMSRKLSSFGHHEWDTPETHRGLADNMAALRDPLGRTHVHQQGRVVPLDEALPAYVREHPERFPGWIKEVA